MWSNNEYICTWQHLGRTVWCLGRQYLNVTSSWLLGRNDLRNKYSKLCEDKLKVLQVKENRRIDKNIYKWLGSVAFRSTWGVSGDKILQKTINTLLLQDSQICWCFWKSYGAVGLYLEVMGMESHKIPLLAVQWRDAGNL